MKQHKAGFSPGIMGRASALKNAEIKGAAKERHLRSYIAYAFSWRREDDADLKLACAQIKGVAKERRPTSSTHAVSKMRDDDDVADASVHS